MLYPHLFSWFFIPAWMVQPLTALVVVGTAWLAQDLLNKFVDSKTQKQNRYSDNADYDNYIRKKQQKDPNKQVGFPLPFPNNDPKDDDNPDKKDTQDPSADPNPKGDPDPNNDDAPKLNIKRNLDPNPDPNPPSNKTPLTTPRIPPISVKNPPYFKRTGIFIYQPLEQYEVNVWSMPVVAPGDSDFQVLANQQASVNKGAEYMEFLQNSRISNKIGKYKISDLIPAIMPPAGVIDANPTLVVGTEAIGKVSEAYENYSDGYLSNPIWFVPTKIKVNIINGNTSKKRRLPPELDDNFKPVNETIPEVILDQNIFKIPKEVTMEQVLEFAGYCATFEGGAEKWEQWKKDPTIINNPLFYQNWGIPTSDDILNEETDGKAQYQKQKLKIESFNEQLLVMAGTLYVKAGLHEFPTLDLPGIKDPQPMPDPDDPSSPKDPTQLDKSNVSVKIGSLAGAMSYFANWFNYKIGDFPAEIEVPDKTDPDKTVKEKMDISQALTGLTTIGLATLGLANINKNIGLTNAGEIEQAKNAALKGAECSCINTANSGFNTKPKGQCTDGAFNFTSAKGVLDMLSKSRRCREGMENDDPATMKAMLENLMFGVNMIKGAVFKGSKEIDNQEQVLRDLLKGKIDDDKLDKFIDDFNAQQTPVTKDYPVKAKIVKRPKGGTP